MCAGPAIQPGATAATSTLKSPAVSTNSSVKQRFFAMTSALWDEICCNRSVCSSAASNAWLIAGATLGSVMGIVALVLFLLFVFRRECDTEEEIANEIKWAMASSLLQSVSVVAYLLVRWFLTQVFGLLISGATKWRAHLWVSLWSMDQPFMATSQENTVGCSFRVGEMACFFSPINHSDTIQFGLSMPSYMLKIASSTFFYVI